MKRFFAAVFAVLVISLTTVNTFGQSPMTPPPYDDFKATKFPDDNYNDRSAASRKFPWLPEERVIKDGPLAPAKGDRIALKSFLRAENTGLMRLLPREGQASDARREVRLFAGGAYYSFAFLTHRYGYGSDVELSYDNLSVGFAGADYGLLLNLGEAPLEQIALEDLRVLSLANYRPPRAEPEARQEYQRLGSAAGLTLAGQIYRRSLPVSGGSTYLLRSIAYSRSDVLVAFRVIRQDDDGSVVIAWKLLQRFTPPKLIQT